MANVNIKFNGKDFLLSCDDGQEEHLEELLIHINEKFNKLKNDLGNIGENKLLLITSVQVMDEYFETKKNNSAYFNVASGVNPPAAITGLTLGAGNLLGVPARFRIKELVFDISNDDNVSSTIAQNQIAYFGTPN